MTQISTWLVAAAAALGPCSGGNSGESAGAAEGDGACAVTCGGQCVDPATDGRNCGACGTVCGGTCSVGRCLVTLASHQVNPSGLAVDSGHVYWTDLLPSTSGGAVLSLPLGGGTVATLAAGQAGPYAVAVDSTSVYWTNRVLDVGTLMKMPRDGGTPVTLASAQNNPAGLAVDATSVYWVDSGNGTNGALMKVPLGGGAVTTLASGLSDPYGIAVGPTSVYWTNTSGENDGNGVVMSVLLAGGAITTLASVPPNNPAGSLLARGVAVDQVSAYWAGGTDGHGLVSLPLAGGLGTSLASGVAPAGVAIDRASVYWTDLGSASSFPGLFPMKAPTADGTVMKVPLGGGKAVTLASGQGGPGAVAIDATSVYWVTGGLQGEGAVMKLTPR